MDTSPFHKENAGKIVFFRAPTAFRQENPESVSTRYTTNDSIYGMAYLKGPIKDLASLPGREMLSAVRYRLFIDGNEYLTYAGFPAMLTWEQFRDPSTTYLRVDFLPDPSKVDYTNHTHYDPVITYVKALAESAPKKNTIRLTLEAQGNVVSEGSFEIDCATGQERLQSVAAALHKAKISKVFLPRPKMTNAGLQQSMAAALKSNGWKQQILKVVITDSAWTIHRNAFGVIQFRSIGAAVAMKEPDGRCRYFTLSFKQDYARGSYGGTRQYGVGNNFDMACENVNR